MTSPNDARSDERRRRRLVIIVAVVLVLVVVIVVSHRPLVSFPSSIGHRAFNLPAIIISDAKCYDIGEYLYHHVSFG